MSIVTGEISKDISGVNQINQDNRVSGGQIKKSAANLTDLAADINEMVRQFTI